MDSLQHTVDEAGVESVGFSGRFGAEEGQQGFVNQQSHSHIFYDARGIIRSQ